MATKAIGKDAAGYDVLRVAIKELLNSFPLLDDGEKIKYEELDTDGGIAFYADAGALILTESEDVLGVTHRDCQYPFFVVYRTASNKERQKLSVQKFLDELGRWICGEPTQEAERLEAYPELSGGREIKTITRDNSYGLEPNENGVQDWLLPITVKYHHEFEAI